MYIYYTYVYILYIYYIYLHLCMNKCINKEILKNKRYSYLL